MMVNGSLEDGRIKVVADDGTLVTTPIGNVEFGAFIERVGEHTVMQKTNGAWIAFYDADGTRGEPTDEPEFSSRQHAIRSIGISL